MSVPQNGETARSIQRYGNSAMRPTVQGNMVANNGFVTRVGVFVLPKSTENSRLLQNLFPNRYTE